MYKGALPYKVQALEVTYKSLPRFELMNEPTGSFKRG